MAAQKLASGNSARVAAVSVSDKKGVVKENVPEILLVAEHGVKGDAHAEGGKRQLSLLALESIDKMRAQGADVKPGDFAENITTQGLAVEALPVGTHLRVGAEAELVITQIGKACHKGCAIRDLVGDCIMPREGVFARVIKAERCGRGMELRFWTEGFKTLEKNSRGRLFHILLSSREVIHQA